VDVVRRAAAVAGRTGALLLLGVLAFARGQGVEPGLPPEPSPAAGAARMPDAAAQLRRAREAKRALWGTRGAERRRLRERAAEAYRAVRVYFPEARPEGAEAAFRAGELWRAGEDDERARREFEVAATLDPGGPFAARAALELGHLEQRAGNHQAALAIYVAVLSDPSAAAPRRDEAALRAGTEHRLLGARELARGLWERVARRAEDPLARVEAFDLLARDLVEDGDLEGAAGMLDRCRRELAPIAREQTRRGERVRRALTDMRALADLRGAVRRRRDGVLIDGRAPRGAE